MIVGTHDKLGELENAQLIAEKLVNIPYLTFSKYKLGHASFIWGLDMSYMDEVIEILNCPYKKFQ